MADTEAILFDIDGTLITTGGASDRAWKRAFKELQKVDVDVPAVTGKGVPDPEVGRVVFKNALGRDPTDEEAEALMRRRLDHLPEEVENSPGFKVQDCVVELLEKLIDDGVLLGLTTGNVEEAAHIKLQRAKLNRFFSFGGYGSDSPDRTELTKRALERAELVSGRYARPGELLLVRRYAARRRGRPRRGHPGHGSRDGRVHGGGAEGGGRRRRDQLLLRGPAAALGSPRARRGTEISEKGEW